MALRTFLATLVCASALAACSATQAAEPLGASCDQFGRTPSVEQSPRFSGRITSGTDVKIELCSNPTTGFGWEDPQVGDPGVIRLVDRAYQAPGPTSLPVVGAAGGEVVTLHAVAAGTTTVSLRYSQPWSGGTKGVWTYGLSVTVE